MAVTGRPERALSFGSAAELYERYRPGYPDAVVDAVLGHARRPVRTAVEVGAGTGKATRVVAGRGISVTALEPDADMAAVLARTTRGLPVEAVLTTFEQFSGPGTVDLVYAAAAWHWTDPATRWTRAAGLLSPGGVLALFGSPCDPRDPQLRAAVEEVDQRLLHRDYGSVGRWSVEDAVAHGFTDAVQRDLPGAAATTAEEFVGRLGTVSAYLVLEADERAEALRQVRSVLPERFELDTTVRLSLARRS